MEDAKQYLFRLRTLKENIDRLDDQIKKIRTKMEGVSAVRYDKISVMSSPHNTLEDNIAALVDLEEKMTAFQIDYWSRYLIIQTQIYSMKHEVYRMVLSEYFLDHKTIKAIARSHSYDRKYIYNVFERALAEFGQLFLTGGSAGNQ